MSMDFDPPDLGPDDPTNPYRYGFGEDDLTLMQLWAWFLARFAWMIAIYCALPHVMHELGSFMPAVIPGAWPH